ncbi:hypothetical protein DRV85_15370 [Rhodosalinus halophilus]|uniref:HdeD family acid-resistance protein n=1 Tax=Rhodosalinus halophilus TaxID=2259333 RepID=A0A365U7C8_9RHOB|nr:DUF308 domain-containing protein [Rhodosalinus halophilus]RBI83717.1 hypothetical protein DRV85_15370 [Rhodosalinus halophilus]
MSGWFWWMLVGILFIVGGVVALFNPFAATVTAERVAAWFFIFGGLLQVVAVFQVSGWGARIWALVLAAVFLWLGVSLLSNPLAGILTLTIVAAIMFLASGIAKIFFSFAVRGSGYFWAMLLSGAISVVLALMVFSNFPQSAAVLLGVLLAVELLSSGATLISYALYLRSGGDEQQGRMA